MPYQAVALVAALAGGLAFAAGSVPAAQNGDAAIICVAAPHADAASAALAAPLRDAVVDRLRTLNAHVVALEAAYEGALAEAATKTCSNIVLTKLEERTGGGRLAMANRFMRGRGREAPPWTAAPSGGSPTASLEAAEQQTIHRGDAITLEYRLTPGHTLAPIASGKLEGRADADGADVLGRLVPQLAGAVLAGGSTPTATTAAATPSANAGREGPGRAAGSVKAPPSQSIDCTQVAKQSRGTFTVEACEQMKSAQRTMTASANDPSASRPGDDALTCDQIAAEMKEQQFAADTSKLVEAQTATSDFTQASAEEQKKREELARKESAETSLLSRLAPTNAAGAANQKRIDAEQKAANERTEKEMAPKATRAFSANASLISDLGERMQANPRMARLAQLAMDKQCKGQ